MKKLNKKIILLIALAAVMMVGVGGTLAYLIAESGPVTNIFKPVTYDTDIEEPGWDGNTKSKVIVKNYSDVPVYVRVAVVANWVKDDQIIEPYTGTISIDNSKWTTNGGYYYYVDQVPAKVGEVPGQTSNLLADPITSSAREDGAKLQVTIIYQSVQAAIPGASGAVDAFAKAAQ